jgi:DNA-binding XRE family transcriptional regulator
MNAWRLHNSRTNRHVVQNIDDLSLGQATGCYAISIALPKQLFIRDYPESPMTFGERLRKARMDAGLQIKKLAVLLGVTQDTVINWEIRGVTPKSEHLGKLSVYLPRNAGGLRK